MKKARLYLAIFAYVVVIKRLVNQALKRAFSCYKRGDRLVERFKNVIYRTKPASNKKKKSQSFLPVFVFTSIGFSNGYQVQILRI